MTPKLPFPTACENAPLISDRNGLGQNRPVKAPELSSVESEGIVLCFPGWYGAMTVIMKTQIDWIPLSLGGVRPEQGKTLAVMQVSDGSQSFNVVNHLRNLGG